MRSTLGMALTLVMVINGLSLMAQNYPAISEGRRIEMLKPPAGRPVRMVFDTDTYNEIDDQFALVYALISPELDVKAVYAAPFKNSRSKGPKDGMEKSYEEILRILDKLDRSAEGFAFKGSTPATENCRGALGDDCHIKIRRHHSQPVFFGLGKDARKNWNRRPVFDDTLEDREFLEHQISLQFEVHQLPFLYYGVLNSARI